MSDQAQRSVQVNIGNASANATRTVPIAGSRTAHLSESGSGSGLLNMAKAGTLNTRTDNDTGVVGASAGHGIATNDKVDVYWADGIRYGMDATVAGNNITVDGGAGANLPIATTAVFICKVSTIDDAWQTLEGDTLKAFMAVMPVRGHVVFREPDDTPIVAAELLASEPYNFFDGDTNPFAGVELAKMTVSSGSASTGAGYFRVAAGYN